MSAPGREAVREGREARAVPPLWPRVALLLWLAVQIAVIGYQAEPPLQLIYGIVGAVILATSLAPGVCAHLT